MKVLLKYSQLNQPSSYTNFPILLKQELLTSLPPPTEYMVACFKQTHLKSSENESLEKIITKKVTAITFKVFDIKENYLFFYNNIFLNIKNQSFFLLSH